MTPDFALSLSFDGITLLRRVKGGWAAVGDVALDAADLSAELAALRAKADALSPKGGQVKLVVPNEQIKYLSLAAPRQKAGLHDAIEAALEGATPYAVADLVYDWSRKGDTLLVAAVARDTLNEAQEFTESHHFVPVSYVAMAPAGKFDGEVFFGPAPSWTGPAPERDSAAIVPVAAPVEDVETTEETPAPEETPTPVADSAEPALAAAKDDVPHAAENQETVDAAPVSAPKPTPEPTPKPELKPKTEAKPAPKPAAAKAPETSPPQGKTSAPNIASPAAADSPPPAFSSIRATREAPEKGQIIGTVTRAPPAAPTATRARITPLPPAKDDARDSQTADAPATAGAMPPRLAAIKAAASTPKAPSAPPADLAQSLEREAAPEPAAPDTPLVAPAARQPGANAPDAAPAARSGGLLGKVRLGRSAKPEKPKTAIDPAAAAMAEERDRMTVFGARQGNARIGGKPRFLGLMLTTALIVFLAAVAAWASVFLDDGLARFFRPDVNPSVAVAESNLTDSGLEAPSVADEVEADAALAEDATEMAALDPAPVPSPEPQIAPERPRALTPQEAEATYAATGIWQRAPSAPLEPLQTDLGDLYVASIDSAVQQFDAVALPDAVEAAAPGFVSPPDPAPAGVVFDLDPRGMVRAAPDGAMNPDGIVIYSGRPPAVPPLRGVVEPEAPAETPESRAIQDRIERLRPQVRPGDIVERNERATLGGRSVAELAALRPTARPDVAKLAEEADVTATELAIEASRKPLPRPRDIARIVEEARARTPDPAPSVQVASAASVAPRIPSSASVAQQATVRNAINLRRVNLIGVYGKASNRRALVRLSNGRYEKVQVGDRIDGGRVAAIGESQLRYTKGGRNIVLEMPNG